MSQKERAIAFMKPLWQALQKFDVNILEQIVCEAQNAPPLGDRDGSMSEGQWLKAREVVKHLDNLKRALEKSPEAHLKSARPEAVWQYPPPNDIPF